MAKQTLCIVCGKVIDAPSAPNHLLASLPAHTVRGAGAGGEGDCSTASLDADFVARFNQVYKLEPARARLVASKLRLVVTKDSRYIPHPEMCRQIARTNVSSSLWERALKAAEPAPAALPAASPLPPPAPPRPVQPGVTIEFDRPTATAIASVFQDAVAPMVERVNAQDTTIADLSGRLEAAAAANARLVNDARLAAKRAVDEALSAVPRAVTVQVNELPPVNVGLAHKQFELLLKMVAADVNVWLCGPAGSGKTTAAEQAARALGLSFAFNGAIDSEYKLSGFVDAQGRIVSTAFRKAYAEGGVYLFDEVDASLPSAVLAFNAALSGSKADFPGETSPTPRHPDFRCIAAANTWGFGGTSDYVGRYKQDAAFLDRFVQLPWEVDEALEMALASDKDWCAHVQKMRAAAKRRGLKIIVSPRATINGCKLLLAGLTREEVQSATVRSKVSEEDWNNLKLEMRGNA